jgi:hypothetical protein
VVELDMIPNIAKRARVLKDPRGVVEVEEATRPWWKLALIQLRKLRLPEIVKLISGKKLWTT